MLGYTDFGNKEFVGHSFSFLPYLELALFSRSSSRWNLHTALGAAYFNKQFDPVDNPNNRGISTDLVWSFRSFIYYDILQRERFDLRFGLGYLHQSNGHTRLPNQGLNSVGGSLLMAFHRPDNFRTEAFEKPVSKPGYYNYYLSLRAGIGQNVLSEVFNDKKEVYIIDISGGKVFNDTFKLGLGLYYRFYEHYQEYIVNNEELIQTLYPHFRDDPGLYASNLGISVNGEMLMGHVGAEINIGFNIYKPMYKVDWQLNDGYTFVRNGETIVVPGDLDSYYEIKRTVSSRLGLKWYFINTAKSPVHNIFLGAYINANLGQADFTELTLGYVYRFKKRYSKVRID